MKIGILSMQMIDNYGSLLQAYGLKKIIESIGGNVEFINIKKINSDNIVTSTIPDKYLDESDGKSIIQKLFNRYLFVRLYNKIVNKIFVKRCSEFRKEHLMIEKKSSHYDLCVIGSDEVFNCLNAGWWGYTSQLFGNVSEADNIITYAASCGATKYENLSYELVDSIKKSMKKINEFSVRDNNTYEFVEKMGFTKIKKNLDPVLIYDFTKEVTKTRLPKLPKHYCVIYSYSYRFYRKEEIDSILLFCNKNHLTPIALQGGQTWCKNFIACTPFECLKIFENSDFVITDTFHGTIFSVKYANKFAVIERESNFNKLNDLIRSLEIENHLAKEISQIESIYHIEKNTDLVYKILEKERIKTKKYLGKYINGTK